MRLKTAMFLLLPALFCAAQALAAAPWTNVKICTQPPDPVVTNPQSPVIWYSTEGNPLLSYRIQISKQPDFSSLLWDTGDTKYHPSTYSYSILTGCDTGICGPWGGGSTVTVSGHPAPRCPCDSSGNNLDCHITFDASSGDPAACYDWYEEPSAYSCSSNEYGQSTCSCPAGGACSMLQCNSPWDPGNPGCFCLDSSTCSSFSCSYNESTGYQCSCADNPCAYQKAYQFTKVENPAYEPSGQNHSYTVPAGTLAVDGSTYYYQVRARDAYDWSPWVSGSFLLGLPSFNGECGTSSGQNFCAGSLPSLPTPELCARYDPARPPVVSGGASSSDPWTWTCSGTVPGGADSPLCSATASPVPSSSNCGTRFVCEGGGTLACQPGMCTGGTTCGSPIDSDSWTCSNSCGSVPCPANLNPKQDGKCGTANGNAICDGRSLTSGELCASNGGNPSPSNPDTNGYEASWKCLGSCGGSDSSCTAKGKKSCGWIETNP